MAMPDFVAGDPAPSRHFSPSTKSTCCPSAGRGKGLHLYCAGSNRQLLKSGTVASGRLPTLVERLWPAEGLILYSQALTFLPRGSVNAEPEHSVVVRYVGRAGACLKVVLHIIREGTLVGCFDFEAASLARPAGDYVNFIDKIRRSRLRTSVSKLLPNPDMYSYFSLWCPCSMLLL